MDTDPTNQYNATMKNKSAIAFIVMLIGAFLSGYYGPWWAPAVFIIISTAILNLTIKQGIYLGGLALMLTFMGMAVWMRAHDHSRLIEKTGVLLGGLSPVGMVAVTSFIGLMTGLLSGWLGSALGGVLKNEN
jgi:hypothetical protein